MSTPAWTLPELDVLRSFKLRMPKPDSTGNESPFDDRVARVASHSDSDSDVPDLHQDVRERIRSTIEAVRDGKKKPQVLLLSGVPGAGKTHVLNTFRPTEVQKELRCIFVGGSNSWQIGEFQAQLLAWLIQALTAPTPNQDHLLLDRIRAIGFKAAQQLLNDPKSWRPTLAQPSWLIRKLGRFGRAITRFRRPSREQLAELVEKCDPTVFTYFDETEFGNAVCDRFLAEKSNLTHRYVLRVLLCYLFPDRHEFGVGSRERVLHWFCGQAEGYFSRRLGADVKLDKDYTRLEAVKLLTHLFSQSVSQQLATDKQPTPAQVLLLTFDQIEGRDELFTGDADWKDFFAQLSELYGTLTNVVILFTMTVGLRNRLHNLMERQFRDRIVMDDKFLLQYPKDAQLFGLYRTRVSRWLASDPELSAKYAALSNKHLPFTSEEIKQSAGNQSVRDALAKLDTDFRRTLRDKVIVGARYDFLYVQNEIRAVEAKESEYDYTSEHINTVARLFETVGNPLYGEGACLKSTREELWVENVPVLTFRLEQESGSPVVVIHLARVGKHYNAPITQLVEKLLYNRTKNANMLVVVRPQAFNYSPPPQYQTQILTGICDARAETSFRALCEIAQKSEEYRKEPEKEKEYCTLVADVIKETYLNAFLQFARERVAARAGSSPDIGESSEQVLGDA